MGVLGGGFTQMTTTIHERGSRDKSQTHEWSTRKTKFSREKTLQRPHFRCDSISWQFPIGSVSEWVIHSFRCPVSCPGGPCDPGSPSDSDGPGGPCGPDGYDGHDGPWGSLRSQKLNSRQFLACGLCTPLTALVALVSLIALVALIFWAIKFGSQVTWLMNHWQR